MPNQEPQLFTPDEVNALIPRLEEHFQNFWGWRGGAQRILEEIRAKARDAHKMDEPSPKESAYQQMRQSQAHYLLEQAKKEIDAILELGCAVKDLEMGLVDFPHKMSIDESEVYLCWKFGEKKVRFWHEIDQGFNSRKPISRKVSL